MRLITLVLICTLLSIPAMAQQDPLDGGAADSVFINVIGPITDPGAPAQLSAELYFFNDVQNVVMASASFSWDNPGLVMDSAVFSPQAEYFFDFFKFVYYRNDIDSTNRYQRFQFVASRVGSDGVEPSFAPKLMCTYFFHFEAGAENDTTCFHREDFIDMVFVDPAHTEYTPIWRGTACTEMPEPPDVIFNPVNGHTYEFAQVYGVISWHEAKLAAEERGGYLMTVTDSIEANIVVRLLNRPGDEAWLGGTDEVTEGVWTWVTGEPWDYTNWYPGEPNAAYPDEDYLLTQHQVGGMWIDAAEPQQGFIIEYEPVTPDPLINLVQWPVSEGGNGHWYAVVPRSTDWHSADSLARTFSHMGVGGHLATVRSVEENTFITQSVLPGSIPDTIFVLGSEYWLGGYMTIAGWHWVTGEPFDYQNWADVPPGGDPDYAALAIIGDGFDVTPPLPGEWVSRSPECGFGGYPCRWSVVEFDVEGPPPLLNLTEWPVSEGGNDHWYAVIPHAMDWFRADSTARSFNYAGIQGHLATVTSEAENQFLMDHILPGAFLDSVVVPIDPSYYEELWMGGYDDTSWQWVTDEPWTYSNWLYGGLESQSIVQVLAIVGYSLCETPPMYGKWVSRGPYCDIAATDCRWSVVEFSEGPIHIPRELHVPGEFATIQMAIDTARDYDRVLVGPGTYHESINFKGKIIEVRSTHGPHATTITADRKDNLVTFDHGETRSAVLDGFTLQGGWMAVVCIGSGPTVSHCICVEQNVTNWAAVSLCGTALVAADHLGDPRYSPSIGPAPLRFINNTVVHSTNGGISSFSSVSPEFRNNIVAFNTNYGIHQQSTSQPQPILGYNDVFDNVGMYDDYINIPDPGPGSISADPTFGRGYTLLPGSPCIDAGDPDPMYNDPDGTRNDIGAVYHVQGSGGEVIPTNEWIVVYCEGSGFVLPVIPPLPALLIQAFDPDGVLCGQDWYKEDGSFGLMPIYRDDPYTDVDEGAGPGDLISFRVGGIPVYPDPPVYWTANGDVFEACTFYSEHCLDIPLHPGWNLISWNVNYQSEIYEAFADIIECIDVVHSFEGDALTFDPNLDMFNTLTHVDHYHGYWVRSKCETALRVCGDPIAPYEWIPLEAGWNLVSYWPPEPMPVEDAFFIILNHIQQAMGFDNGAEVWLPGLGQFNTLIDLRPLSGYWTKAEHWLQLSYPGFFPPDCTSFDDGLADRGSNDASLSATETSRTWMSVYGRDLEIDGRPVADGAVVEFLNAEEVVCGRSVYEGGLLKFTPVYGLDDSGEQSKLYPKDGDAIAIAIDGERVYPDLTWEGNGARVRLESLRSSNEGLPTTYVLEQNYPNPFNPDTRIAFSLPVDGHVTLAVFNVLGQKVRTVTDQHYVAGNYEVEWDGRDESGESVSTGVYFYRLTTGEESFTKKMMLLK